ncbi:hypothetical protein HanRHA438_Chr01g0008841 [Helianthus annuus]|uniref:Uncharacterized protein n=1 Tax=Helianthus annuus TaxID=4232 RepID=A0A251VLP2_HELAN|nr:hypothetical protein HanXRQr2_Chr01g0008541 [Helianthus annuus]KAJ0610727.1 hypothetical protein HanHA300_Chr01g0007011 [Helianthus annuus]KAJ0610730.1 hypothetical protein HanHA300_Chr01g0007041 [Helianthus annuus]KAJ0621515.1 hypothetical protein HanIR_Chr01g0009481 [Helianthus annuus]KAJ0625984.1 hypothetical protein HanHA89_Chr01g0007781 [Helianthus annuus]
MHSLWVWELRIHSRWDGNFTYSQWLGTSNIPGGWELHTLNDILPESPFFTYTD